MKMNYFSFVFIIQLNSQIKKLLTLATSKMTILKRNNKQ